MAKSTARDEKILKQTMWYENCKYEKDAHNKAELIRGPSKGMDGPL